MEFDPVNNSNAPPSRYQLESDSEEEEEDDQQQRKQPFQAQATRSLQDRVSLSFHAKAIAEGKHLNVLLGQSGVVWLRSFRIGDLKEDGTILVDGVQQASISLTTDASGSIIIFLYPTVTFLTSNELHGLFAQTIMRTLKPQTVTLVTSYSPYLYIQSQDEKDAAYQRGEDDSGFPPVRFLLAGKGCQDLKTLLLSKGSSSDIKYYRSPNALTGLAGTMASQSTLLSLPLMVLLLPELTSQPHSHHHSHAFLPSSSQDPNSRPQFSSVKLEARLLAAIQSVLKAAERPSFSFSNVRGSEAGVRTLEGFLSEGKFETEAQPVDEKREKAKRSEAHDSMYL